MFSKKKEDMDTNEKSVEINDQNEVSTPPVPEETTAQNETGSEEKEKIAQLESEIAKLSEELKSTNDKFIRKVAEFDNYKRRIDQEQTNLIKYSSEGFIAKILPVIDDLERSLKFTKETDSANSVRDGVQMIFDKFMKIMNEQGIKKIDSIGNHFDVHLHEAVMMMPRPDVEALTIIEEIESGYYFKDKVLRHSKVIVAMSPENDPAPANSQETKE